jgi:hypothetical protein
MTVLTLPAPARPTPLPRLRLGQPILTPENRVAIYCGSCLTPNGLQAFIVDAATPVGQRKSRMVPYRDLRAAPCGGPRLTIDNGNARNPFAGIDKTAERAPAAPLMAVARRVETAALPKPEPEGVPARTPPRHRSQIYDDAAPIPAFLRASWPRDGEGRRLKAYPPRIALLALLAFRIWPSMALRRFDLARTIEAARTGAVTCGPSDLTLLSRLASSRAQP